MYCNVAQCNALQCNVVWCSVISINVLLCMYLFIQICTYVLQTRISVYPFLFGKAHVHMPNDVVSAMVFYHSGDMPPGQSPRRLLLHSPWRSGGHPTRGGVFSGRMVQRLTIQHGIWCHYMPLFLLSFLLGVDGTDYWLCARFHMYL